LFLLTGLSGRECSEIVSGLKGRVFPVKEKVCGTYTVPHNLMGLTADHHKYLRDRGFYPDTITRLWRVGALGYASHEPKWRLFIPIHRNGMPVSWTSRTIKEGVEPRYFSATDEQSAVSIKDCLYGIDYVRHSCIITEGPLDTWAIGPGAVALMGLRCSPAQMERLSKIPVRMICLDNEPAAQVRARKLQNDLSIYPGLTINIVLASKDAASAKPSEIQKLREMLS